MAKRILSLVRHGHYTRTTPPSDEPDGPVTERGWQQVLLTADRLSTAPIPLIHTSPLHQTTKTALLIATRFLQAHLRPALFD